MGLSHSPSISVNGLVLCLDAGNTKSYPGSGTTWTDLTGRGNNATLFAGPTYSSANGGFFSFNGTSQYAQVTTNVIGTGANLTHSIEMWVNFDNINIDRWWLATLGPFSNGSHHWIGTSATATGFGVYGGNQTAPNLIGANQWLHLVSTFNGTSLITYVNNNPTAPVATTQFNFSNSNFSIALRNNVAEDFYFGKVSIAKIYNRALTATEVRQNFNALRGRYGI